MLIAALVFAGLAALIHVYIFVLESLRFDEPSTWVVFGVKGAEEAAVMRPWAYNQGFYNLFLAIGTAAGIGLTAGGDHDPGLALVTFCCGSMVAAALVLVSSTRARHGARSCRGRCPRLPCSGCWCCCWWGSCALGVGGLRVLRRQ